MACEHIKELGLCFKCDKNISTSEIVNAKESARKEEYLSLYLQDRDEETWLMCYYVEKNGERKIAKVCKFE